MLLSWRPFSIPHDSILIFWLEEMDTAERCVCDCVRVCVCVLNQAICRRIQAALGGRRS